jgi:glycosyltransferase involved in cell wall biosynthesis
MGDGPDMDRLKSIRRQLHRREQIVFTGYRADASDLVEGADICVVPSVWQEAFGLSAREPLARGVPVIATRVGGIPEVWWTNRVLVSAGDGNS